MKDIDSDSDSVDCIVTDPPYGLVFMGKDWDKAVPSVAIWEECLRVLKPGAFAFVMCIPRQDGLARMICRLEDAGFNVAFSSIYWTYASGFPKAQNLSKAADKRAGVEREVIGQKKVNLKDKKAYTPNSYRGLQGTSTFLKNENMNMVTISSTSQAKALDGAYAGFQPKPAVEIIVVAMKPIEEKTYLDQAMSNEHGCTWLDNCRIPFESKDLADTIKKRDSFKGANLKGGFSPDGALDGIINIKGRFPANVLCEDDVFDDGRERNSSERSNLVNKVYNASQPINFYGKETKMFGYPDKGSFSRYFSLDAWFVERIKHLPKEAQKTFPFMIIPKASKSERDGGLKGKSNIHPTCKSIKLMSWLITLASREGDIVLDPFCGSGTTAIAAKMLGRQYIGIEREEDYCEIARKRISAIPTNLGRY
jgi:site-specific DNA-methyltransferase (adenine-specific)